MAKVRFNIGERVCRPTDVFKRKSKMRYGRIVMRYKRGFGDDVYQVRMEDTGEIEKFLEHGIHAAAENEGRKHARS